MHTREFKLWEADNVTLHVCTRFTAYFGQVVGRQTYAGPNAYLLSAGDIRAENMQSPLNC